MSAAMYRISSIHEKFVRYCIYNEQSPEGLRMPEAKTVELVTCALIHGNSIAN